MLKPECTCDVLHIKLDLVCRTGKNSVTPGVERVKDTVSCFLRLSRVSIVEVTLVGAIVLNLRIVK